MPISGCLSIILFHGLLRKLVPQGIAELSAAKLEKGVGLIPQPAWSKRVQATADRHSLPLTLQKPRQGTNTYKVGSASSSEFNFEVLIPMSSDRLRLGHTKTSKNQGKKEKLSKAILKESRMQNVDLACFLKLFADISGA